MKVETVNAYTKNEAKQKMSWASKIIKVCGWNKDGIDNCYRGYESVNDYKTMMKQK